MEGARMNEVWFRFVLPEIQGGRHYTGQKVHMCMLPLQGQRNSKTLVGILHPILVTALPNAARCRLWWFR